MRWSRVRSRLWRAVGLGWYAAATAAGGALVAAGTFRDVGAPDAQAAPLAAAAAIAALLVVRLVGRLRVRPPVDDAGGEPTPRTRRAEWRFELELGAMLLVGAYALFQATGGPRSLVHPLAYALVAFLGTFFRRGVALALAVVAMALEAALAWGSHGGRAGFGNTTLLATHVAFLALFALLHLAFLQAEIARQRRQHRRRLADDAARRRAEAREFRLIGSQLGAESRTRSREAEEEIIAAASVENIHQALFYNLELLKKSLELHTIVLLWLDEDEQHLRIKELVTDSDAIAEAPLAWDAGLLGAVVKERQTVRVRDPKPEHLPYYDAAQPVGAFLGVPVVEEGEGEGTTETTRGHLRGVLCADRLCTAVDNGAPVAAAFDARDEALLQEAARELLRAIAAERVFVAVERSKYEHERFFHASDMLNRALTPEQVFDTAFKAARELADFDFAAISLYDSAARRHRVVAALGEGADEVAGLAWGDNAGLVAMAIKNKHMLPANGERRDREMPVFVKKAKLRGMESLLVLPLVAADEAIGAFTLAARAPRRFGKDKRELLGVIANQVAVSTKNAEMYRAMEQMATTDGLTGLVNHRTFQERFADLLHRAERQGGKLTLLLTDIDHFKKVNDTHGHPVGDQVLKGVAAVCREQVRRIDVAARYGGEEFAIVLDATDREGARLLAERIRKEVAAQVFSSDKGEFCCTLSLGIATYPDDGKDPKTLIANSDQALYHAKHNGRNRAVAWADIGVPSAGSGPLRAVK